MSKILLIEPNMRGNEHLSFNAAMLNLLHENAQLRADSVLLFCERTHRQELIALLPDAAGLSWEDIPVVPGTDRRFVRKFLVELVVIFKLILRARQDDSTVVLLSVFPNVLCFVMLFRRFFRNVRLNVILHGQLESLIMPEKRRIHQEGFWTRIMLFRLYDGSWPNFYVLGEGLKSRLLDHFRDSRQLQEIRVINHPYIFTTTASAIAPMRSKIRIGFVGVGRAVKGIEDFFSLAESFAPYITAGTMEFVVIGGVEKSALQNVSHGWVRVLADRPAGLTADEYSLGIASLDCAVMLNRHDYRFTASGSVLDLINHGVEVLSLHNHYLNDLSRWDSEGGIKLFASVNLIERAIRDRLADQRGFSRFSYSRIKQELSLGAGTAIASAMFRQETGALHGVPG